MVAVLLLLALEFMCLGLLALLRFRAAGLVLINVQLQRILVVLGVALTLVPLSDLYRPARRSEQQDQGPQPPRLRTPRHRVPRPPHPLHPRVPVQTHRNLTHAAEARHVKPISTTPSWIAKSPFSWLVSTV